MRLITCVRRTPTPADTNGLEQRRGVTSIRDLVSGAGGTEQLDAYVGGADVKPRGESVGGNLDDRRGSALARNHHQQPLGVAHVSHDE